MTTRKLFDLRIKRYSLSQQVLCSQISVSLAGLTTNMETLILSADQCCNKTEYIILSYRGRGWDKHSPRRSAFTGPAKARAGQRLVPNMGSTEDRHTLAQPRSQVSIVRLN